MADTADDVIDLSNPLEEGIPTWPTFPAPKFEKTDWRARDGFTMEHIELRTHTGTHIDAPMHFIPGGKALDDFPVSKFMGTGVVLDLTPVENAEPIAPERIEPFEDEIEPDDVVMLHTGWDEHYGLTPEYLFEYPHLSEELAQYFADLEVKAVGVDSLSVGGWYGEVPNHGPSTEVHPEDSHLPLLENDIIPIEELRNLGDVLDGADSRRAEFFYPPLNLQWAGGSPVRAFASL